MAQTQSAKSYSQTSSLQRDSGYQFLQQLSPSRGFRVLDLGCGIGTLAAVLSECVGPKGKVVAVDPDGERLKIAQEKNARDNIEYVNGDDATYPEGPYELVFANQVVHWVHDKEALFGRVYKSLQPSGRFAFVTCNGAPEWPPAVSNCAKELFGSNFFDVIYHRRMIFLSSDQLKELAESHGFAVSYMEDKVVSDCQITMGNVNDLVEFFFGMMHGQLDRQLISEQALKCCRDKYDNDLSSEAEVVRKTRKLLYVILTKR